MTLSTDDFDYPLPAELIAQCPPQRRDASRLMRLDRAGGVVSHHCFGELPGLLRADDLLVMNDTRVLPARLLCRRGTGGRIEGLFVAQRRLGLWEVLLRGAGRCRIGEVLTAAGGPDAPAGEPAALTLMEDLGQGHWLVAVAPAQEAAELLERIGSTPLPPYIRRQAGRESATDRSRYQTVYAARSGAVAAPTAGLHFTPELLEALAARGIERAFVTLHVGIGTFTPVKAADVAGHTMHAEWYNLPPQTAEAISRARRHGRRIVAVGTTSVRVLQTAAAQNAGGELTACSGATSIFIYPPAEFIAVDAMITNFHLPKSTLLMLVAAFCQPGGTGGIAMIKSAYAAAVAAGYRFFSYGDAMLIE
jgi:S-adenosylmethionine:tRNA ribosyltransferase-isomerase